MYAVTLPLCKPFITACLGAGFGGVAAALFHIGTVSQGVSGFFGLLIVVPGQQLLYVLAMLAAYAGGFVLTWFFGVDEEKDQRLLRRVGASRLRSFDVGGSGFRARAAPWGTRGRMEGP